MIPLSNAVRGRGEKRRDYTDAQKRQAVNKGLLRVSLPLGQVLHDHRSADRMNSRLIDEAWAVYVGEEVDGEYPNSSSGCSPRTGG